MGSRKSFLVSFRGTDYSSWAHDDKQLRYRISATSFGVDEINALSRKVQASLLEAFGIAADTKFLKGKAVGSV